MNNLKTTIIGALSFLIIISVFLLNQNDNTSMIKKDLDDKNDLIVEKPKLKVENKIVKNDKEIINKEVQPDASALKLRKENLKKEKKINDKKVDKINQKKPKTIEQLKKDFNNNKEKFNISKDSKINFLHNEKTDPYSKLLIPQEIDKIKKDAKEYEPSPVTSNDVVVLKTNNGTMKLKLFPDIAPKHCYNFKKLANSGYYDGTTFHRIIPNFMIQGGDILSRDGSKKNDGQGGPGWTVDAEFNKVKHKKGILSMARSSDPNSAGSQFFICHADAPHLDGKYTAFGEVIDNLDIIDKIANAPTQYSETKKMCSNSIPTGENKDDWVELLDPKTRRKLYAKVPKTSNKSSFKFEMSSRLKDNSPMYDIRILSLRVE